MWINSIAQAAGSARRARGGRVRRPCRRLRRLGGRERQHRPQPLAAGEQAVAHRLADDARARGRRRQIALERRVDLARARASRKAGSGSVGGTDDQRARIVAGRATRAPASARRARSGSRSGAPLPRAAHGRSATAARRARTARATARAARSPSSSFLTIDSSSAIAASKSLIDVSIIQPTGYSRRRHAGACSRSYTNPRLALRVRVFRRRCRRAHLALELAARERDADRSPRSTVDASLQDVRLVGVPADGIAAAEHRERTERLEPAGQRSRSCASARWRRPAIGGGRAVRLRRRAAFGSTRAGGRDRTLSSCRRECCRRRVARGRSRRVPARASACVSSAAWRPRIAPRREAGEAPAGRRPCTRRLSALDTHRAAAPEPIVQPIDPRRRTRPSPRRRFPPPPTASARAGRRRSRQS